MTNNADPKTLIREMQENVAKYGRENTTTYLMVQAITALQQQDRELEAVGAGGVQSLSAAPKEPYSIDADPQGIRVIVANAITGALAFGAHGTNPPPAGHWLVPFWNAARAERTAPQQEAQEPVAFMSPKQLATLSDPEGEHGTYLPVRKTCAGLFTQAIYTTPQPAPAPLTMQPLVLDSQGVLRFQKNALVDALYEHGVQTGLGLNELHSMDFSDADRQQFAQLIGYSLSGYGTLSYVTDEAYAAADRAALATQGGQ